MAAVLTRRVLLSVVAIVLLAMALLFMRIQPDGHARVIRRGTHISALTSRVGLQSPLASSCLTSASAERLEFRDSWNAEDSIGEAFNVEVRFQYRAPDRVPAAWAAEDADWCALLRTHVHNVVEQWLRGEPFERLRTNPRSSGDAAATSLQQKLAGAGIEASGVSVRPRVPVESRETLPVPEIAGGARREPPLIVIGLDGADWELLDRYIAAGLMPNLASLVSEGSSGVLLTQHPPLSPLVWTSMMTGTSPLEHEILDFTRFHPTTGVKEPITSDERKKPAVWNMATYAGKSVAVFGLWATYPAEPVRGLLVSDRLFTFLFSEVRPPPGTVYPPSRDEWARATLRQVEASIGYEEMLPYLPWLDRAVFDEKRKATDPYSHPVSALRRILVETSVFDSLARDYLRPRTPDLTILYLQGTDSIGHVFAPYTAPRQPNISEEDFAHYSRVPEQYFRHIDAILGAWKTLARQRGARLMIASDHGFHWIEGRPEELSSFAAATAAKWHRKEGIYLVWGPGITPSRIRVEGGGEPHVAQFCATVLALTGVPPAQRIAMPPVIVLGGESGGGQTSVNYDAAYARRRVAAPSSAPDAAVQEELAKLKALGYIGAGEATSAPAAVAGRSTHTAGWYNNRALILRDEKKPAAAAEAYATAISIDPNLSSALWNLSDLLHSENRELDRSDTLLIRALENGLPDGVRFVIGRAIGYQRSGMIDRSLHLLEQSVTAKPDNYELRMFRGRYRIEQRDCPGALADFRVAATLAPDNPIVYATTSVAQMCLGDEDGARQSIAHSLAIDPNQPKLRAYLNQLR